MERPCPRCTPRVHFSQALCVETVQRVSASGGAVAYLRDVYPSNRSLSEILSKGYIYLAGEYWVSLKLP